MTLNEVPIHINNLTDHEISFDVEEFIDKAINELNITPTLLEFSFTNDSKIKEIHNTYMNLNTTTDVITFNLNTTTHPHGDIYICIDDAKRNAKELNHSLDFELKTLIVHALLHLMGYTDTTDKSKKEMFLIQDRILEILTKK